MPTTTSTPQRTTGRRSVRTVALTVAAAAAATLTTLALGFTPQAAQADPGDTFVAIGTSQLVQSEDLSSILVPLDTASVELNRNPAFAPCIGGSGRWTQVLKGSPRPIAAYWSRRGTPSSP